jgi:hypothetical protein
MYIFGVARHSNVNEVGNIWVPVDITYKQACCILLNDISVPFTWINIEMEGDGSGLGNLLLYTQG